MRSCCLDLFKFLFSRALLYDCHEYIYRQAENVQKYSIFYLTWLFIYGWMDGGTIGPSRFSYGVDQSEKKVEPKFLSFDLPWFYIIYHLYLSNLETCQYCVYLSMKYRDWSTKWDLYFEHRWRNSNKNQQKQMLEICLYLSNLKTCQYCVYLSMKYKDSSAKWDFHFELSWSNSFQ